MEVPGAVGDGADGLDCGAESVFGGVWDRGGALPARRRGLRADRDFEPGDLHRLARAAGRGPTGDAGVPGAGLPEQPDHRPQLSDRGGGDPAVRGEGGNVARAAL